MTVLKEKHNCRSISHATKAAFIIDGANYFEAFAKAIENAQKTIFIAGWDIDSRIKLIRRSDSPKKQKKLGNFLNDKVKRTPRLRIYILNWDLPMLYLREREWLPFFKLGWKTHRRISYHLDDQHPIGASQHQKFVVIDNKLAFCGGFDLSNSRWDTREHLVLNSLRKTPEGTPYSPFHDVQMIVEGDAAMSLSELFKERWLFATGKRIKLKSYSTPSAWPQDIPPAIENLQIALSTTFPEYKGRKAIKEIENLYVSAISSAKKMIYIENQYLTSVQIAEVLEKSLKKKNGPEICIILPEKSSGWLEQSVMDSSRAIILQTLFKADIKNRLRVLYAILDDKKTALYIHAKLMIVDDKMLLIGSANLSTRSMHFDSECCLSFEAKNDKKISEKIISFRNDLISEHLGLSVETVCKTIEEKNSVNKAIKHLSSFSPKGFKKIKYETELPENGSSSDLNHSLLDPEGPIKIDILMDNFVKNHDESDKLRKIIIFTGIFIFLIAFVAVWHLTSLSSWGPSYDIATLASKLRSYPVSFLAVFVLFLVGSIFMLPVTILVAITTIIYDPIRGIIYSWSVCILISLITFSIGSIAGKKTIRKLTGKKLRLVSRQIFSQNIFALAVIRNIHFAPFTVVNLVAGASHIKLKNFLISTSIGLLPGIMLIGTFTNYILKIIKNPNWINITVVVLIATSLVLSQIWLIKRVAGRKKQRKSK